MDCEPNSEVNRSMRWSILLRVLWWGGLLRLFQWVDWAEVVGAWAGAASVLNQPTATRNKEEMNSWYSQVFYKLGNNDNRWNLSTSAFHRVGMPTSMILSQIQSHYELVRTIYNRERSGNMWNQMIFLSSVEFAELPQNHIFFIHAT